MTPGAEDHASPPQLGDLACDIITGFEGVVIKRWQHVCGSDEYELQKVGAPASGIFDVEKRSGVFAADRIKVVERGFLAQERGETVSETEPANAEPIANKATLEVDLDQVLADLSHGCADAVQSVVSGMPGFNSVSTSAERVNTTVRGPNFCDSDLEVRIQLSLYHSNPSGRYGEVK